MFVFLFHPSLLMNLAHTLFKRVLILPCAYYYLLCLDMFLEVEKLATVTRNVKICLIVAGFDSKFNKFCV